MAQRSSKIGLPPGSLVHIGSPRTEKARISIISYDEGHLEEREIKRLEEAYSYRDSKRTTWINVYGVHDLDVVQHLGEHYRLHPLLLEDLVNTQQRPKVEEYDEHTFFVLRMMDENTPHKRVTVEQVSLVLGPTYVICFQERPGDIFDNVRERIRSGKKIRARGADYLAYALVDTIVDHYFAVLERFSERLEVLEEDILNNPAEDVLVDIQHFKRDVGELRRAAWPVRDMVVQLEREAKHVRKETLIYFRDVYDHAVQIIDTVQNQREMVSGLLDIHLSQSSNRMNEIMKVLTVISTIFIPLTFITGVYGMNFQHMPELVWRHGYFLILGAMFAVAVFMALYFKKKHWF